MYSFIIAFIIFAFPLVFFLKFKRKGLNLFIFILFTILGFACLTLEIIYNSSFSNFYKYFLVISAIIFLFIGLFGIYSLLNIRHYHLSIKEISMVGVMSAITFILYYFVKFNLPFFPPWLDIQLSEIPALISGFAYGPYAGAMVILVRFALKLPGSITFGVGEMADLILGLLLVIISSLIYKKHKTIKGAILATLIGILCSTIAALILNYLVLIPSYIYLADFPIETLISMMQYLPFEVTKENFMLSYLFVGVLPFNLFRYLIVFVITFLIYKRIHRLLNKITNKH